MLVGNGMPFLRTSLESLQHVSLSRGAKVAHAATHSTLLLQVKVQFSNKPQVYNKFLDIMKDFKSQKYVRGILTRLLRDSLFSFWGVPLNLSS